MKTINVLIDSTVIVLSTSFPIMGWNAYASDDEDIKSIVDLMNTHACKESDKIVIVPEAISRWYMCRAR